MKTFKNKDIMQNLIGRQGVSDCVLSEEDLAVDAEFAAATGDNLSRNSNLSPIATELKNVFEKFTGVKAYVVHDHTSNMITLNTSMNASMNVSIREFGIAGEPHVGVVIRIDASRTISVYADYMKAVGILDEFYTNVGAKPATMLNSFLFVSRCTKFAPQDTHLVAEIAITNEDVSDEVGDDEPDPDKAFNVKTNDNISLETSGGSGAFGTLAGVGANVAVSTSNNAVGTEITGNSMLTASDALTIDTTEMRCTK